jgi:hypothetical protein
MHVRPTPTAMTLLGAGIDTSTIALWLGHEQERTTHVCLHADLALKPPPSTASAAQSHGDDQARSAARARCQRHCAIVISGAMVHALGTTRLAHDLLGDRLTHAASAKSSPSGNAATRAASSGPDHAAPQSQTQVLSHAR